MFSSFLTKFKNVSIWTGKSIFKFLVLLHKAIVAFYHVMKGNDVVAVIPPPIPPFNPPVPPPLAPPENLPEALGNLWETITQITDIVVEHLYDNYLVENNTKNATNYTIFKKVTSIRHTLSADRLLRNKIAAVLIENKTCKCDKCGCEK